MLPAAPVMRTRFMGKAPVGWVDIVARMERSGMRDPGLRCAQGRPVTLRATGTPHPGYDERLTTKALATDAAWPFNRRPRTGKVGGAISQESGGRHHETGYHGRAVDRHVGARHATDHCSGRHAAALG